MCEAVGTSPKMFTAGLFMAARNWETSVFSNKGLVHSAFLEYKCVFWNINGYDWGKKKEREKEKGVVTFHHPKL